jgi:uncharacterized protein (TIGR03435 family)
VACVAAVLLSAPAHGQVIDLVTDVAPVVREAVPAVLDLFEQYSIVALSEGPHNNQKGHDFRLALVRDPRFGALVDDVVVEFGNARYQTVMDRFTAGADVPYGELRQVWENTTIPGTIWDSPIYYEFFAAIRDVNRATGSRIRVVLGDPPVDWASIRSADQIDANYAERDRYPATVIQQEVLNRNRRALVVYGEGHLLTSGRLGVDTLVDILQRESNARIFTIANGYPDLSRFQQGAAWPVPGLVMVKGTTVGGVPSAAGTPLALDFDAVLHLGGPSALAMTEPPKTLCDDRSYVKMRLERFALSRDPAAEFKKLCGILAFEVASIKRSLEQTAAQSSSIGEVYPGGVWRAKAATVYGLIRTLYPRHSLPGQIDGVREWVGTEFYDIDARGTPSASPDDLREMARTLLTERFKLAMHAEMREAPAYVLTTRNDGRLGAGLSKPAVDCDAYRAAKARGEPLPADPTRKRFGDRPPCETVLMAVVSSTRTIPGAQVRVSAGGATIGNLLELLSRELGRPVIDRTGLVQPFDIELQYSVGPPPADGEAGPPLKAALADQLGLRVEDGRATVEVLVIDRVERPVPD